MSKADKLLEGVLLSGMYTLSQLSPHVQVCRYCGSSGSHIERCLGLKIITHLRRKEAKRMATKKSTKKATKKANKKLAK